MIEKIKVYKEKGTYIGILPAGVRSEKMGSLKAKRSKSASDRRLAPFRLALKKAQMQGFRKKEIVDFVQDEFLNEQNELLTPEDYKELIKKEANRRHQKLKRYRRKVEWFEPNFFVTFTYDNDKCDENSFENKLLHTISNLACRHGWRAIGTAERGKKTNRLHYHFMMLIPDGEMVGELFTDYHWDGYKREYFTNNTYFHERFGDADFKPITVKDKLNGTLSNYLVKYIVKYDGHIYYSRGLPAEKEMEIDLEEDVFLTYVEHGRYKVILSAHVYMTPEELKDIGADDWIMVDGDGMGFNLDIARQTLCAS